MAIEAGINTTGFPSQDDNIEKQPQDSPIGGIHARYSRSNSIYFDLNVRYTVVGYHQTNTSQFYDQNGDLYTIDVVTKFKFNKLGLGGGAGLRFQIGSKPLNVGAGLR